MAHADFDVVTGPPVAPRRAPEPSAPPMPAGAPRPVEPIAPPPRPDVDAG